MRRTITIGIGAILLATAASAEHFDFTYQGLLREAGQPVDATCDFVFRLYSDETGGEAIDDHAHNEVAVDEGLFTVEVNFFEQYDDARWMEIDVRCPASFGSFVTLTPRQPITAAPRAIVADNLKGRTLIGDGPRVDTGVGDEGSGFVNVLGANGQRNVLLSFFEATPNDGFVGVYGSEGNRRVELSIAGAGNGGIVTYGPSGNRNVLLSAFTDTPNDGFLGIYDEVGVLRAQMAISTATNAGFVQTYGPNGSSNTVLGQSLDPDRGYLAIRDENGNDRAGMQVNESGQGEIFADLKHFVVDHPTRPGHVIRYSSVEAPEVAIVHRGSVELRDGRAAIELPEHFSALAVPESITVQLTPGSLESKGLAFSSITEDAIAIGELGGGSGSYPVHYVVHAVRRGHEDRKVVLRDDEWRAGSADERARVRPDSRSVAEPLPLELGVLELQR